MEISGSAAAGVMRVGLQVVSNHKKPLLEFYYELRNRVTELESAPEHGEHKPQLQEIFIQFSIVNIGGVRAENVEFVVSGLLRRNSPRESLGKLLDTEIPQIAPGQVIHLFRFEEDDLYLYPDGGGNLLKNDELQIIAQYDAPPSVLNWIMSLHKKICGKKQYESKFLFKPAMVCGDLPPAEYV